MWRLGNTHTKVTVRLKGALLFFLTTFTFPAVPQHYIFRNFNTEEGLIQSYVYSIIQDAKGYLWIGTGDGLSRYNGFVFENFTTGDSLADNFITCGIRDGEFLWFGHMNGQLSYYDGNQFWPVSLPGSGSSPVTHFDKSPGGRIWVSTYADGLYELGKNAGEIKHYIFKDQEIINSFGFLDSNSLLVGTNTGLFYCRLKESGEIDKIKPIAEIPESKITCIQKKGNRSGYYIATENDGIFQVIRKGNLLQVSRVITSPDLELDGLQDIYEDSQSNLWIGTFGKGLIRLIYSASGEFTTFEVFNTSRGFPADNVKIAFEDREGNMWSGNYGKGLTQITRKVFSVITFDKSLYGNDIFSIYINKQFRWIGTERGLLKVDQMTGDVVKFYSRGSGLPQDSVTAIYSSGSNVLWIGTDKNGLFRMEVDKGKFHKYTLGDGDLENSVTIINGKGEQVWIGTKKGLYCINTGTGTTSSYSINQGGLPHNFVNCIYIDRTGRLWVSTRSNTLAYIQDEKINKIPLSSGGGILTLGPITEDASSLIWVGSNGNGVFRITSDSVARFTVNEGLLSDYCYSLKGDKQHNIWVGHKGGLSRIRTTDFSVKPIQQFEGIKDMLDFNTNAIFKDEQEMLWFGSDKGMVTYDPSMDNTRFLPPVLSFTSIRINDKVRDFTEKIVLPPGYHKVQISFLGISLKEPELVTYQYKLDNYDQWSEITKNTSITYNRLTEGTYTFILKASSGDGAVTENPLTIEIVIKKPVWKKWWFYFSVTLLLVLLIYLYIKRREYIFLTEKRILEEKVRERTYEIECQKNEIELQRDLIDKKNNNITSSITYASHIQNAILPPQELIDRLFPDHFILSKPKDIVSGDFYWLSEKDSKIIFAVADCTGHGVPGAFMSLLGITLLNEIVNIQGITRSDAIVNCLRKKVIHSLQQSRKDVTTLDGIDIVLCVLEKNRKVIQYTGGMNDLVYIRNGELNLIKADHLSVSVAYEDSGPFTLHEIKYRKGDVFYLFSDGFQDQFGGEHDKKYLSHRFYNTLLEIYELPIIRQKEILEQKLNEWKKDRIQTDDITVMGIRF